MTLKNSPETGDAFSPTRRRLLLGAAASGLGAVAMPLMARAGSAAAGDSIDLTHHYPFYGNGPQAGIQTPVQRHAMYMTFTLTSLRRQDLQVLLARWSAAIAQMMQGKPIGQVQPARPNAIGSDTGEALGLEPASLTVTVGLGPRVFSDTYGFADRKPALFRELKPLPSDALEPGFTGGDLSLQACADDPQVAYHAIRDLARIAKETGTAATRWTVLGFGRAAAGPKQTTPRNLLGFRDGTRNIRSEADFNRFVWINEGPASWQRHGTYQIVRKVKMNIEAWDTDFIADQQGIFGRYKVSGAPLTGKTEFDTPDFQKRDANGKLVIPPRSHIRLAAHENNGGIKILRRSFNYTDGINNVGLLDAGLLFICYVNDPSHFETLQEKLGAADALNEYVSHIGSGIFYVPPAAEKGAYIGKHLFA